MGVQCLIQDSINLVWWLNKTIVGNAVPRVLREAFRIPREKRNRRNEPESEKAQDDLLRQPNSRVNNFFLLLSCFIPLKPLSAQSLTEAQVCFDHSVNCQRSKSEVWKSKSGARKVNLVSTTSCRRALTYEELNENEFKARRKLRRNLAEKQLTSIYSEIENFFKVNFFSLLSCFDHK